MAVTLDGGGGLFDRLGRLGYLLDLLNARRGGGSADDFPKELNDVLAEADGKPNEVRQAYASLLSELESLQAGMSGMPAAIKQAAQTDLINSFDADDPLPELSVEAALDALWRQMRTAVTRYVDANTLGATVTSTGNTGTGAVVAHTKDGLGVPLENLLAEDLLVTVTDVSTPAAAQLRVRGEAAQDDKLHWLWPAGSGADASFAAIDAADTAVNLLANGTFNTFTAANTPDNWTIAVGVAGTDIFEEATTVYVAGGKALKFLGTGGAPLSQIYQSVLANVDSRTVYALNCWVRVDSAPAAGVLVLDLHDGTSVINDEAGNAITVSIDLTTVGTTFAAQQLKFALPEPLPTIVRVRIRLSTALTSGRAMYLDHLALAPLAQPGTVPGATPYLGFFSGSSNWAADDGSGEKVLKIAVTNNRASQWQEKFDEYFDASDLGFTLPTAGTTLLNDNLIA